LHRNATKRTADTNGLTRCHARRPSRNRKRTTLPGAAAGAALWGTNSKLIDPVVRRWMNYYGRYYRTKCIAVLHHINPALARWARRKYKRLRYRKTAPDRTRQGVAGSPPRQTELCSRSGSGQLHRPNISRNTDEGTSFLWIGKRGRRGSSVSMFTNRKSH
jgi:hypothetical protein